MRLSPFADMAKCDSTKREMEYTGTFSTIFTILHYIFMQLTVRCRNDTKTNWDTPIDEIRCDQWLPNVWFNSQISTWLWGGWLKEDLKYLYGFGFHRLTRSLWKNIEINARSVQISTLNLTSGQLLTMMYWNCVSRSHLSYLPTSRIQNVECTIRGKIKSALLSSTQGIMTDYMTDYSLNKNLQPIALPLKVNK